MRQFFRSYADKKPSHVWAFVYGPPGVGKTSAVRLLATEAGFEVREFNASETRSRAKKQDEKKGKEKEAQTPRNMITRHLQPILENAPLYFCKPACLVLEEVDGMAGPDKDCLTTIGAIIKTYEKRDKPRVPVVLLANEATQTLKTLAFNKKNVLVLQFTKLDIAAIRNRLHSCFRTLGFPPNFQPIDEFITNSDGDFRKTINAHQFWLAKQIQKDEEAKLCGDIGRAIKADREIQTPNDAYKRLFRDDITDLDALLRSDEFDPFLMRQFMHENLLPMLCVEAPRKNYMTTNGDFQPIPIQPGYITPICAMMSNGDLFQAKYLEPMAGIFLTVAPVDQATAVWNHHKKDKRHPVNGANVPTLDQMLERGTLYPKFPTQSMGALSKFRKNNNTLRSLARHLCDTGNAAIDARPQIYLHRAALIRIINEDAKEEEKSFAATAQWMLDHNLSVDLLVELLKLDPPLGCDEKTAASWPVDTRIIQRFVSSATNDKVTKVSLKRKRDELAKTAVGVSAASKKAKPLEPTPLLVQPPPPPPPPRPFVVERPKVNTNAGPGYKGLYFGAVAAKRK